MYRLMYATSTSSSTSIGRDSMVCFVSWSDKTLGSVTHPWTLWATGIYFCELIVLILQWTASNRPFSRYSRCLSVGRAITIRTLVGCRYRYALRAKHLGSRAFFPLLRLVWTASALDHLLICCSAPNTENDIINGAYQRCRVHVDRYCVASNLN